MKSLRTMSSMKKTVLMVASLLAGTSGDAVGTARMGFTQAIDPIAFCNASGLNVIIGTSNNDTLNGTPAADCIVALGGQDIINSFGGNNIVFGG